MKKFTLVFMCSVLAWGNRADADQFVRQSNGTNAVAPYASWETAATNIADALLCAVDGDTVWVDDGHYRLEQPIVVTNQIEIRSVNGSETTIVDGQGSVRCFSLGKSGCVVSGLTVTNGYVSNYYDGAGIYCSSDGPFITNCVVIGNVASNGCGGGVYNGRIADCVIYGNRASSGGGVAFASATNCIIRGNYASSDGGGLYRVTADNCLISGNRAFKAGGINVGTARNCTIVGNTAISTGGGVGWGSNGGDWYLYTTLYNCIVYGNRALIYSDIHRYAHAEYSCSPDLRHGVHGNITNAPALVSLSHLAPESPCIGAGSAEFSVGTDLDGEAWLDAPSMGCDEFYGVDSNRMQVTMNYNYAHPVEGQEVRFTAEIEGVPSMNVWNFGDGCRVTNQVFPFHAWSEAGSYDVILSAFNDGFPSGICSTQTFYVAARDATAVYVSPSGNDANSGADWASAKATIKAGIEAQEYDGGLVLVEAGTYALTNWIYIDKAVVLRSVSGPEETIVDGQGTCRCFALSDVDCVISGFTITNGYSHNGGSGVTCGGCSPVVTNCVITGNKGGYDYSFGGGMAGGNLKDSLVVGNYAYGGGGLSSVRAENCVITGNTAEFAGGVEGGTMTSDGTLLVNCTISDNAALNGSAGGLSRATAVNCLIKGNTAPYHAGGAWECSLYNCTVVSNTAGDSGGGVYDGDELLYWPSDPDYGVVYNCVVWGNSAPRLADLFVMWNGDHNCAPEVTHGYDGNTTNAPAFVDAANGDYRLMTGSPCINAGSNGCVATAVDLSGYPRVVHGRVDLGAYEYIVNPEDYDGDGLSNAEEATIQTDATLSDSDSDGEDDGREVSMGFDPTSSASRLGFYGYESAAGYQIGFFSTSNHLFIVESRDSLTSGSWIERLGLEGAGEPLSFLDENIFSNRFYRVRVEAVP